MILKVLVGSRAHGLAGPDSDYDYRGVFVRPTSEILALGAKGSNTQWNEADKQAGEKADDTSWELGHFLHLATHCNPTILEVFAGPVVETTPDGDALRELLPAVWHPKGVRDAFVGYGLNQRKKFLEDKDTRPAKYASAYLRVLYQAWVLLRFGSLITDFRETPVFSTLKKWRDNDYTKGEVIDLCLSWQQNVELAYAACKQQPDLARVNAFLLDVRRRCW